MMGGMNDMITKLEFERACVEWRDENVGRSFSPASEFENETAGNVHEDEGRDDIVLLERMSVLDRPSIGARLG